MLDPTAAAAVQALARLGSFREAAQAVGISTASFSRRIAQAEAYAGHSLFERRRHGTRPTPAGREFLRLLGHLDAALTRFEQDVDALRDGGADVLTIGCGPLTTRRIISPLVADLLAELPDIRVRVLVRATKEPLELLRQGRLDIAICDLTHTPDLSDLELLVIRKEPVSFWARPAHPIHTAGPVPVAEVFRHPFATAHLHRHWRAAIAQVLGGDAEAERLVERLPQIESDDFGFLADLCTRTDLICGGIADLFAEHAALGRLTEVRTTGQLTWNICAARAKQGGFPALERLWQSLAERYAV